MDTKTLIFRIIVATALIVAALPTMAVSPARAQTADNLIVNGGFEAGSVAPWQGINATQLATGGAYSGNNAVKITSQVEANQGWISVTPGKSYELTAWFKWVEFSGSNWGYDRIQVVDSDWSELAVAGKIHTQVPQNSWNQVKLTFTPKTSGVRVIFGLFGPQDKVELYFDEFQLKQAGPAASENLAPNGDFENDTVAPWQKITNTNLVTGNAQSGARAIKITTNLLAESDWIPVDPAKTYEYTAWFKWNQFSGTNWGYPRLQVVNSDWSEAGVVDRLHTLYPKGQYSEVKLVFKPKADKVRLIFGQFGPQGLSELYFDNVGLKVQGSTQPTSTAQPTQTATKVAPTATNPPVQPTATNVPAQPTATNAPVQPTAAPTSSANLITNGDFEASSLSPWTGLNSSNLVSSGAYSGTKAVRITSAVEARQLWVTVEPGKPYTVSAWFKWVDFTGSNWGYPRIQVVNGDWSEAGTAIHLERTAAKNTWTQVNITVTPKSDKLGIIFGQFGPQDRIDLYFDAFSVSKQGSAPQPTAVQPTATIAAPTATATKPAASPTSVPPTATKTSVPPTATKTSVSPTAVPPTATQPAAAGNLVQNAGFENGVTSWSGINSTNIATSGAYAGTSALKITSMLEARQIWMNVTPGKPYQLDVWFKWVKFSGSNWGKPRIQVVSYDWNEVASVIGMNTQYPVNTWSKVTLNFTPTQDKVGLNLGMFGPQDQIEIYFDEVSLAPQGSTPVQPTPTTAPGSPTATATQPPIVGATQIPSPTPTQPAATPTSAAPTATPGTGPTQPPVEMLQNTGFESGVSPWQNITDANLVSSGAQSGSKAVKLTTDTDVRQGWIQVTPGKSYTVTAWYKWNQYAGSQWGYDRLRIVNQSWSDVATLNHLHNLVPQGQWGKVALNFTPQVNQVMVSFGQFGPQDQVEIYYDSISLTEKTGASAPTVTMTADKTSGTAPLTVKFTATGTDPDGAVSRYFWDFGDGSSDTTQNPSHTYMSAGKFIAKVTVWDQENLTGSTQVEINVTGTVGSAGPLAIQQPTSSDSFSTSDSGVVLSGVAPAAKWVSWDNVSTDEAGVIDGGNINSWTTPRINLKPGKNEILITAQDSAGKFVTDRLWVTRQSSGPVISNVQVSSSSVPVFEKYEIKFDLATVAENYFYQYETAPPTGVKAGIGVTAEALITSPSGKNLKMPAFWTVDAFRDGGSGIGHYSQGTKQYWAVRFSPQETGTYQVSLRVQDASGTATVNVGSFNATGASDPGYIKVSKADTRYFEYSNGSIYWPLGPVAGPDYGSYVGTGMTMQRPWMAAMGAYSTNFARWISTGKQLGNESYDSALSWREHYPSSELSQELYWQAGRRFWLGWLQGEPYQPQLKANTNYMVKARIKTMEMSGPVDSSKPYGFMIKAAGWPDSNIEANIRNNPSFLPPVNQNSDWFTVVGKYNTGSYPAGPYLYFFLDNVSSGKVYIDQISIKEIKSDGTLGGEQVFNSKADLHAYVDPRGAAAIDYQVTEAERNGVYLKYVVMDKRDWVHEHLSTGGSWTDSGNGYYQPDGTKSNWLQRQWWRYLIARWGYSTAIHSWELNNEGSPDDKNHWAAAERFGKYMHTNDPHPHLVTTSFWCCWKPEFWKDSTNYPNVDYADIHEYIRDEAVAYDIVGYEINNGASYYGAGVNKPVMMGEYGIHGPSDEQFNYLKQANNGDWFHDMLWSQLSPGALYNPNYWYTEHLGQINEQAITRAFYLYVKDLDLNKGGFSDAQAAPTNSNILATGQKNNSSGRAYLWIQNKNHTWKNVMGVDGGSMPSAQSCTVNITMSPNTDYTVQWWDTSNGAVTSTQTLRSDGSGKLSLTVSNLQADVAVKIIKK